MEGKVEKQSYHIKDSVRVPMYASQHYMYVTVVIETPPFSRFVNDTAVEELAASSI